MKRKPPYSKPKFDKKVVNFRLRNDQVEWLRKICREFDKSPSDLFRDHLDRLIAEHSAKSA